MSGASWVVITIVGMSAAAGCGGKACPPQAATEPPAQGSLIARVNEYEAAACACKDLACIAARDREMTDWMDDHSAELAHETRDPLRRLRLDGVIARVTACRASIVAAASPAERAAAYPEEYGIEQAIAIMARMADDMCACRDMPCVELVMRRMSALKEPDAKPSKADMEQAMKIAQRMAECQKRLMQAGSP